MLLHDHSHCERLDLLKRGEMMEQERVYSPRQAAVGAFIGGPLASVLFIKRNFIALGNPTGERKTLLYGITIMLVLLVILPFLPRSFPRMLIPFLTIFATWTVIEKYQFKKQDIANSGALAFQSNWRVLWVSLACMVLSLLVIGAVLFGLDALGIIKLA